MITIAKVCVECGQTIKTLENGVMVRGRHGEVARADLYGCEVCGYKFLDGFGGWLPPDVGKAWLAQAKERLETVYDFHATPA